jgi:hypothetical protein
MKPAVRRMAVTVVSICCAAHAQLAHATMIPISFETPTYSTTADPNSVGVPGTIHGQDGWSGFFTFGVGQSRIRSDNSPIAGLQSLWMEAGNTGNTTANTRGQASGLLTDSLNNVIPIVTDVSWLVRRDTVTTGGGGAGNSESGITTDAVNAVFNVLISLSPNLQFQYWNGSTYLSFPNNPTYSLGTVYRVEIENISDITGNYDAAIYDNGTNALVASGIGLALGAPIGNSGVKFFAVQRGRNGNNASYDDITAIGVPEPGCLASIGFVGSLAVIPLRRRRASL